MKASLTISLLTTKPHFLVQKHEKDEKMADEYPDSINFIFDLEEETVGIDTSGSLSDPFFLTWGRFCTSR